MPPEIPSLVDALGLLASGVGAGLVIAFLFEKFSFFQSLPANIKWWFVFLFSTLSPIVATALLQIVPTDVWAQLEPYWHALMLGLLTWAGSQLAHVLVNHHTSASASDRAKTSA